MFDNCISKEKSSKGMQKSQNNQCDSFTQTKGLVKDLENQFGLLEDKGARDATVLMIALSESVIDLKEDVFVLHILAYGF